MIYQTSSQIEKEYNINHKPIGEGAFGEVYHGKHIKSG
jgi:hypothetical protein